MSESPVSPEEVMALEGIVDAAWYSGLLGREVSPTEASEHYLTQGRHQGLTPHPLIDAASLARSRDRLDPHVDPAVQYARTPALWDIPTHPLLATASYVRAHPEALSYPGGPPQHWLDVGRAEGVLPGGWWAGVEEVLPRLLTWHRQLAGLEATPAWPAGESVVLVRHDGHLGRLRRLLDSLQGRCAGVGVLLTTAGLGRGSSLQAASLTQRFGWLTVDLVPVGTDRASAWARLLDLAGPVLLVEGDVEATDGWPTPILAALDDPAVGVAGSLLLGADGSLRSAGQVRCELDHDDLSLLEGFAGDEPEPGGRTEVSACANGAVAVRPVDLLAIGVDLSARELSARVAAGGRSVVACHDSRVIRREPEVKHPAPPPAVGEADAWRALGFEVVHDSGAHRLSPIHRPGALRWAIKCPAPAGRAGATWGDVHFAEELARGLRAEGQHAVVDRAEAFDRRTGEFDDVAVVVRGLREWSPPPGTTSMLWIISHPDEVPAEEAARFDAVFAASGPWADEATARWRRPVLPLLQAVDPARFHPGLAEPDTGPEVVFVGGYRPPSRPIIEWALEADLPLAVYGHRWEGRLPPGVWRSTGVPRDQVGALYRSAGLVLCDHWGDMAREGFIQNRAFDVVAAGGRAVSDPVVGLAEQLPGVVEVSGPDDLRAVYDSGRAGRFGTDEVVRERAAWVSEHHSFRARARALIEVARGLRAAGSPLM